MSRWRSRRAAIVLILAASVLPEAARPADAPVGNHLMGKPAAIAAGRALYEQHCVICHGKQGGRGPDLFQNTLTDLEFYSIVVSGRSGARGQMPSWAGVLTGKEIWQIEAFVKSRPHL